MRRRKQLDPVARMATQVLETAAGEIDGNPRWYRSHGSGDYFVIGDRGGGSHYDRRGVYINRISGLPFNLGTAREAFDDAYRCADGQLRLTATTLLEASLWDVANRPAYQLAYEAACAAVRSRTEGTGADLETFNDDPAHCRDSREVADVFREAARQIASGSVTTENVTLGGHNQLHG